MTEAILAALAQLPDAIRQAVSDKLWSEVPSYIEEKAYNLGTPTQLTWNPVDENPVLIKYATVWSSTAGAPQQSGTLQLGDWQTPVSPGINSLRPYKVLYRSDVRLLSVPAINAGPLSVLLAGIPLVSLVPVMRR